MHIYVYIYLEEEEKKEYGRFLRSCTVEGGN